MAAVRVAVVGTGGIATRHGFALKQNPNVEIIGAIDVVKEKREAFAARWGGTPFDKLSKCLEDVDAVYILTPPGFRRQYAVEAMNEGKHVFCEKPLALTVADGDAIV